VHGTRHRRAGDKVAAELRENDAFARGSGLVARSTDSLQTAGNRRRRFNLNHQIDRAHVDAELE